MKISAGVTLLLVLPVCSFVPSKSTIRPSFSIIHKAQQTPEIVTDLANDLISFFDPINEKLSTGFRESLTGLLDEFSSTVTEAQSALARVDAPVLQAFQELATRFEGALQVYLLDHPSYQPLYNSVSEQLAKQWSTVSYEGTSPSVIVFVSTVVTYSLVSSILSIGQLPPPSQPYPLQRYDAATARAYFDRRLTKVVARGLEIATASLGFGLGLLQDYVK
jgi:hypothetical protein